MDHQKSWNWLKKLFYDNEDYNKYTIMCQIEDGTIIIECPECHSNNIGFSDEHYYCEDCDWYQSKE